MEKMVKLTSGLIQKYYGNPEEVFHEIKNDDSNGASHKNNWYNENISENPESVVYSNGPQNEHHLSNEAHKYTIDAQKVYSPNWLYSCYYCNDLNTDNSNRYERHVVLTHSGRAAYPNKAELEKFGLDAQGRSWEV